jgi:hypothetical protein
MVSRFPNRAASAPLCLARKEEWPRAFAFSVWRRSQDVGKTLDSQVVRRVLFLETSIWRLQVGIGVRLDCCPLELMKSWWLARP